jgi:hypothetical protein
MKKYMYIVELKDSNERIFLSIIEENVEKMMKIVYNKNVGIDCKKFGII